MLPESLVVDLTVVAVGLLAAACIIWANFGDRFNRSNKAANTRTDINSDEEFFEWDNVESGASKRPQKHLPAPEELEAKNKLALFLRKPFIDAWRTQGNILYVAILQNAKSIPHKDRQIVIDAVSNEFEVSRNDPKIVTDCMSSKSIEKLTLDQIEDSVLYLRSMYMKRTEKLRTLSEILYDVTLKEWKDSHDAMVLAWTDVVGCIALKKVVAPTSKGYPWGSIVQKH